MKHLLHISPLLLLLLCFINVKPAKAQTSVVTDEAFRNYMCTNYPYVMDVTCSTLDSNLVADTVNGEVNLSNLGITNVDQINYFYKIDTLNLSYNLLDTFPDFYLISVDRLILSYNQLKHFPEFKTKWENQNVTTAYIDVSHNQLETFTFPFKTRKSLKFVYVQNNNLTHLEPLDSFAILKDVNLSLNKFTFEDFMGIKDRTDFATSFTLFPQKNIELGGNQHLIEKESFDINLFIDDTISTNVYHWFKDGTEIATTSDANFGINEVTYSDSGYYYFELTNTLAQFAGQTIYSDSIYLKVGIDTSGLLEEIQQETCSIADVILNPDKVNEINSNLVLKLQHFISKKEFDLIDDQFSSIYEGTYHLIVYENDIEIERFTNWLTISQDTDCDRVISPNDDGIQDEYYIERAGQVNIYSKTGELIKTIIAPGIWDATNQENSIVPPGIYFLQFDEEEYLHVTVVR